MNKGLQDTLQLRDLSLQATRDYALSVIDANRECFVAQWVQPYVGDLLAGEKMKICGYCEYGYRLFMTDCGSVVKLPIPYVFTEYHGRYWW